MKWIVLLQNLPKQGRKFLVDILVLLYKLVAVSFGGLVMKTKLRKAEFEVHPVEIKKAVESLSEGWAHKYAADVDGRYYQPKEVILNLLKMKFKNSEGVYFTKMDFTTMDAVRILRRLGFKTVGKEERSLPKRKRLSSLAAVISLGGDSVNDSGAYYD